MPRSHARASVSLLLNGVGKVCPLYGNTNTVTPRGFSVMPLSPGGLEFQLLPRTWHRGCRHRTDRALQVVAWPPCFVHDSVVRAGAASVPSQLLQNTLCVASPPQGEQDPGVGGPADSWPCGSSYSPCADIEEGSSAGYGRSGKRMSAAARPLQSHWSRQHPSAWPTRASELCSGATPCPSLAAL